MQETISKVKKKTAQPVEVKLITHTRDLLFSKFIQCVANDDYSHLIIQGEPSYEQLQEAWLKILSQYYTEVGNSHMDMYIEIKAQLLHLEARKIRIETLLKTIRFTRAAFQQMPDEVELLYSELRAEGYEDMAFTPETLEGDLKQIEVLELNNEFQLRKLKSDHENLAIVPTSETTTEERLLSSLFDISRNEGTTYRPHDITVQEYCFLFKRLQKAIDRENIKQAKNGR